MSKLLERYWITLVTHGEISGEQVCNPSDVCDLEVTLVTAIQQRDDARREICVRETMNRFSDVDNRSDVAKERGWDGLYES